jgi:DNA mismatch repair protein MutS2
MTTPEKSLITLEYDKVIARLAQQCGTARGKALAQALKPSTEYREILKRQRLTAEGMRLVEMKPNASLGGVRDIGTMVTQAARGHALEPSELLDVQETLAASRVVHEMIERLRAYLPFLAEIADGIADFRTITEAIGRAISPRGDVLDTASPVLANLRRESRVAHDRLTTRLNQILGRQKAVIQEPIVTLRDGRYVIPIKAEQRAAVQGVVHDVSSSGATLFMEPLETVEMGNKWRELLAEEQREIARILRDLSAQVGGKQRDIHETLDALAVIDLTLAKARLGVAMGGAELPHDDAEQAWLIDTPAGRPLAAPLRLENARHPLLSGHVVPITLWLGEEEGGSGKEEGGDGFRVLLITGPNTGGKTVALKTVGLLALMAQAGLPVPADNCSQLPVFDAVFADIGDEQSIEQSLSTFSSHVKNIISILEQATDRSLVLLDELAAGTDPVEGSALAKAIISHLLNTGCLAVATTHHGELKAYAHVTPGVTNASVEFDAETLSPTYRLQIGLPGQSNALAIAERLGMPDDILEEAREGIDPDRLAVESLISHLHQEREAAATASAEQRAAAREAERARAQVTKELESLQSRRERLIQRTQQEMEAELQQARARLRDAVRELERTERMTVFERAQAVEAAKEEVGAIAEVAEKVERKRRPKRRAKLPPIEEGDRIFLLDVPTPGEALSEPDEGGDLEVSLGSLRARVNVKQIERVEKAGEADGAGAAGGGPRQSSRAISELPSATVPELDLRGLTVDEALLIIDQRLDEAARSGVGEMRIIHGKGTGTLRRAVREMLRKHALVQEQASAEPKQGGDGVTVVELVR